MSFFFGKKAKKVQKKKSSLVHKKKINKKYETWESEGKESVVNKLLIITQNDSKEIVEFFDYLFDCNLEEESERDKIYDYIRMIIKKLDPGHLLSNPVGVCGKKWGVGTPAFKCKTCETDPTCCICQDCFVNGDHEGHDFSMTTYSNGICDCGDPESWKVSGFCKNHKGPDTDPLQNVPPKLLSICKILVSVLLKGVDKHLNETKVLIDVKSDAFQHNLQLSAQDMNTLTLQLQNQGTVEDNQRILQVLRTILARQQFNIPGANRGNQEPQEGQQEPDPERIDADPPPPAPKKEVEQKEVEPLLNEFFKFLEMLICDFPCFKRLFSIELIPMLPLLLTKHTGYRFENRKVLSQFYTTLISDLIFKKAFAENYILKYNEIMTKLYEFKREETFITNISVQFLTVPHIIKHLLSMPKYNFLDEMFSSGLALFDRNKIEKPQDKTGRENVLNFDDMSDAISNFCIDLRYIFSHRETCQELFKQPKLFKKFINLLSYVQFMHVIYKIDSDDQKWEKSFRYEYYLFPKLFRIILTHLFSGSDEDIAKIDFKDILEVFMLGIENAEKKISKIIKLNETCMKGPISLNMPLQHFLGFFLHYFFTYLHSKDKVSDGLNLMQKVFDSKDRILLGLKYPLKALITTYHVVRRFWPRNNMGIVHLVFNYLSSRYKDYSFTMDFYLCSLFFKLYFTLDSSSSSIEELFNLILTNFDEKSLFAEYQPDKEKKILKKKKDTGEKDQKLFDLELDFLRFFLTLYFTDLNELYNNNESLTELTIIHYLCSGDREFKDIREFLPRLFRKKVDLDQILKKISNFKLASKNFEKSKYSLKLKEVQKKFNPYFIYLAFNLRLFEKARKTIFDQKDCDEFFDKYTLQKERDNLYLKKLINSRKMHQIIFWNLVNSHVFEATYDNQSLKTNLHLIILLLDNHAKEVSLENFPDISESESQPIQLKSFACVTYKSSNFVQNIFQKIGFLDTTGKVHLESMVSIISKLKSEEEKYLINRIMEHQIIQIYNKKMKTKSDGGEEVFKDDEGEKKRKMEAKRRKIKEHRMKVMAKMKKMKKSFHKKYFTPGGGMNEKQLVEEGLLTFNSESTAIPSNSETKELGDQKNDDAEDDDKKDVCCFCHSSKNEESGCSNVHFLCQLILSSSLKIVNTKITSIFGPGSNTSNLLLCQENLNLVDSSIQINSCLHLCHSSCFHNYWISLVGIKDRPFKGYQFCDLNKTETVCPLCSRLQNSLFPYFLNHLDSEDWFFKTDKIIADIKSKKEYDNSKLEFTLKNSISNFGDRLMKMYDNIDELLVLKKEAIEQVEVDKKVIEPEPVKSSKHETEESNLDEKPKKKEIDTSLMKMINCLIYNILTSEMNFRYTKKFKNLKILKNFFIFVLLKLDGAKDYKNDENKFLYENENYFISSKTAQLDETTLKSISKILSNDLFSFFVRYLILNKPKFDNMDKIRHFIQRIFELKVLQFEKLPNKIDEKQKNELIRTFLFKIVLIYSILFDKKLDELFTDKEPTLIEIKKFLGILEDMPSSIIVSLSEYVEKMEQKLVLPKIVFRTDPFRFIKLPNLYQNLFLKYQDMKCKNCDEHIKRPALDLISGTILYSKLCKCEKVKQKISKKKRRVTNVKGTLTKYIEQNYSKVGLFLLIRNSAILLIRDNRKSILNSPYRNKHGETDYGLREGKNLFLNTSYLNELIPMLILNSFDQDTKILSNSSNYQVNIL